MLGKAVVELESSNEVLDDIVHQKVSDCLSNDAFTQETTSSLATVMQRVIQTEQRTHAERFNTVKAFMQHQQSSSHQANTASLLTSQSSSLRLEILEQLIHSLQEMVSNKLGNLPSLDNSAPTSWEDLVTIKEEIKRLKQQIGGTGITVGHQVFQSYEDFAAWVKTGVPPGRFGLFVDGHSLLDFFFVCWLP